jgi:hypothetical protein
MKTTQMSTTGMLVAIILFIVGCKNDSTGPVLPKNPREYAWAIDTLFYPNPGGLQTLMRYIWGSSSDDIYICGYSDGGSGKIYHFDGARWNPIEPALQVNDLKGIYGFSSNQIFAVGNRATYNPNPPPNFLFSNLLIQHDGAQWRDVIPPPGGGLQSIWGRSATDFWVGGADAFLAHYNGSQFTRDSVPYTFVRDSTQNSQITQIIGDASRTYLVMGNAPYTIFFPIFYFYERVGSQWVARDSSYDFARLFISPQGPLYRVGRGGVQRQTGNIWTTVLGEFAAVQMAGSAEDNVFAVGYEAQGRVYHYNGSDWFEFVRLRLENVIFYAVWTDGKEAFVIGNTSTLPMKTVVLHGK